MIDIPVLAWIARPVAWFLKFAWSKLRIKDGSFITLRCLGDTEDSRPELLYLGLRSTESTCLVRLLLAVSNEGRAPVRNLAVRIQLPRNLSADVALERANPAGSATFYSTKVGRRDVILNFETSLRIDEGAAFPILLRIRASDWIEVMAGGPQKKAGNLILTDYRASTPLRVVALKVKASAQADNIRVSSREWDVWLTPTASLDQLENRISALATIQRIWSRGSKSFIFPFRGSMTFIPSSRRRFQSGVLAHLESNEWVKVPEVALLYDTYDIEEFMPVKIHRHVAANPGEGGIEFRNWVRSIRGAKPEHYE